MEKVKELSGITFRYIPAPRGNRYRLINEPTYVGNVRPFWMMEAPMTVGQINALGLRSKLQNGSTKRVFLNYQVGWRLDPTDIESQLPETIVSYIEVSELIKAFAFSKIHTGARLPTEFEWEWAALGGEEFEYAGCKNVEKVAWHNGNIKLWKIQGFCDNKQAKAVPVKKLKPNQLGLYDMNGNVCEWANSFYTKDDTTEESKRVIRGGGWHDHTRGVCVANRGNVEPDGSFDSLGFRLCFPA